METIDQIRKNTRVIYWVITLDPWVIYCRARVIRLRDAFSPPFFRLQPGAWRRAPP